MCDKTSVLLCLNHLTRKRLIVSFFVFSGFLFPHFVLSNTLEILVKQGLQHFHPLREANFTTNYVLALGHRPLIILNKTWQWECVYCVNIPHPKNGLVKVFKGNKTRVTAHWEIHEQARWGDGVSITAHDVVLAWKILAADQVNMLDNPGLRQIVKIEVDEKNAKKFKVTYRGAAYNFFHHGSIYMIPSHLEEGVWEKSKKNLINYYNNSSYFTNPTSPGLYSGPYLLKKHIPGKNLSFYKNPYYFVDSYFKKIKIIFKNSIKNLSFLKQKKTQIVSETLLNYKNFNELTKNFYKKHKSHQVKQTSNRIYEQVTFNLRNPILKDPNVRKALLFSIDRLYLVKKKFHLLFSLATTPFHPNDPFFYTGFQEDSYSKNLSKAHKLLQQSGWKKDKKGIYERRGENLRFKIETNKNHALRRTIAKYLQESWKKLGVQVDIVYHPSEIFFGNIVKRINFSDIALFAWVAHIDQPPSNMLSSSRIPNTKNEYFGQNISTWYNEKVDRAMEDVFTEFDHFKRKSLMEEVQREFLQDVPFLPLFFHSYFSIIPIKLTNYFLSGHLFPSTGYIEHWNLIEKDK